MDLTVLNACTVDPYTGNYTRPLRKGSKKKDDDHPIAPAGEFQCTSLGEETPSLCYDVPDPTWFDFASCWRPVDEVQKRSTCEFSEAGYFWIAKIPPLVDRQ